MNSGSPSLGAESTSLASASPRVGLRRLRVLALASIWIYCGDAHRLLTAPVENAMAVALVAVVGDHRFFEPRLSPFTRHEACGSDAAPSHARCRTVGAVNREDRRRARSLRQTIATTREGEGPRAAFALQAAGLWELLWLDARPGGVDKAVSELLAAARASPEDARISSDLGAAHLIQAINEPTAENFLRAVAATHQAVALAPREPGPLFNLALALEKLPARAAAASVWARYLEVESDSAWALEAENRRQRLTAEDGSRRRFTSDEFFDVVDGKAASVASWVASNADAAHDRLELDLLPEWAARQLRQVDSGEGEGRSLEVLEKLALAFHRYSGDPQPSKSVRWAARLADVDGLRALAKLGEGISELRRARPDAAEETLSAVDSVFRRLGSPMTAWSSYHLILCAYQRAEYKSVLIHVERLRSDLSAEAHPHLLAHLSKIEGLVHLIDGSFESAVRSLTRALSAFESLRETHEIEPVHSFLGRAYSELGAYDHAWRHAQAALRWVSQTESEAKNRCDVFSDASELAMRLGELGVALLLQQESVAAAEATGRLALRVPAYRRRAEMSLHAGFPERAHRDVERVRELLDGIDSVELRRATEADLWLVAGEAAADSRPGRALEMIEWAQALLAATAFDLRLPRAHLARVRALRRLGRHAESAEAAGEAIHAIEQQRARIEDGRQRTAFQDQRRKIYDLAVLLHHELGEGEQAFAYAEAARGRVLAEMMARPAWAGAARRGPTVPETPGAAEIRRALSPTTVLVHFTLLPDRLLAWLLSRSGFTETVIKISPEALRDQVDGLFADLWVGPAFDRASERLFAILQPALAGIPPGWELVVVPDGPLYRVPFAALRDPRSGRYLIQNHSVVVAPSASIYRSLSERSASASAARRPALVVAVDGGPSGVGQLAGGRAASRAVADLYRGVLLEGAGATPERVLKEGPSFGMIHVASHAEAAARRGQMSRLLLAPEGRGALSAARIARSNLAATDLVVLAACETAGGLLSPTEGVASLARAFMAAGVRGVIATHWLVEDRETARFSIALHRRLLGGARPREALRATQIEFLSSSDPSRRQPAVWGAFQFFGSGRAAG